MVTAGRPIIHIPTAGEWSNDPVVRDWPEGIDRHSIAKMENSNIRVVCIGDEATVSVSPVELSWPMLLESHLQKKFTDCGRIGVINCGIKGCGIAGGIKRFSRDIAPFTPQLVIFSFAIADALLNMNDTADENNLTERLATLTADFEKFVLLFDGVNCKLLCWLPNPIYPQENTEGRYNPEAFKNWCARQIQFYDLLQSSIRKCCEKHGIELVDARSLFEVSGAKSAQKWMSGWLMHNEQGAMNIANWLMDRIVSAKLLDDAYAKAVEAQAADALKAAAQEEGEDSKDENVPADVQAVSTDGGVSAE